MKLTTRRLGSSLEDDRAVWSVGSAELYGSEGVAVDGDESDVRHAAGRTASEGSSRSSLAVTYGARGSKIARCHHNRPKAESPSLGPRQRQSKP